MGIRSHKAGKIREAENFYTSIIKTNPKHPDANHNLGLLKIDEGNLNQALNFLKTALEINPDVAQFWLSYIDALVRARNINEATNIFDQAMKKGVKGKAFDRLKRILEDVSWKEKDQPTKAQIDELQGLYNQGSFQNLIHQAQQNLIFFPNSNVLHNLLAAAQMKLERYEDVVKNLQKVLKIIPPSPVVYNNMGIALTHNEELNAAAKNFHKALQINPNFLEVYNNLAIAAYKKGDWGIAMDNLTRALEIKPDYVNAFYSLGILLENITFNRYSLKTSLLIVDLLQHQIFVNPRDVLRSIIGLVKLNPEVAAVLSGFKTNSTKTEEICSRLGRVPLLLKIMSLSPMPDLDLEELLTFLRREVLLNHSKMSKDPDLLKFHCALAAHCFVNEYVFYQTDIEAEALSVLDQVVQKNLLEGHEPDPISIVCLASYKALSDYPWHTLVKFPRELNEIEKTQVFDVKKERNVRKQIQILQNSYDETSSMVRKQYEENPYPRWIHLRRLIMPKTIYEVVTEIGLRVSAYHMERIKEPEILIAGCGTGEHSIVTSSRFANSKLTAIDLSLNSLAYAKRKTEELGIDNIEYMQADILDLKKLGKKFDIIEAGGVLHHLADPMAGWSVLADCLKPGGLMKLALYSEKARQHVKAIRMEIEEAGIKPTRVEMKDFRKQIFRSKESNHEKIRKSLDFYSLSTFRDLLFHVREHCFSILQIQCCLKKVGLFFVGFETTNAEIKNHFLLEYSGQDDIYDLEKWDNFESKHPNIFANMYTFWCQKVV